MKSYRTLLTLCLFVSLISILAIGGCNNNDGSQGGTQALTENDFFEAPSLNAKADRGIAVTFLEHPDTENPERDTGGVGIDTIPYKYTRALGNTFCWEDEDQGAEHFMTLVDSEGVEVLMVEANGKCVTEAIEDGDYEMRIHHDGRTEDSIGVFIQVTEDTDAVGSKSIETNQGVLKTAKSIFSRTLRNIGIIQEAGAQTVVEKIKTLLETHKCPGCDLHRAKLRSANLSGANLRDANLSGADLRDADLLGANLNGAHLSDADLSGAGLVDADLSGANLFLADLRRALFIRANLSGANLGSANLSGANLSDANLRGAHLIGANLSGANLGGAFWCDGVCRCADLSIGTCVGCPPRDTCTGS